MWALFGKVFSDKQMRMDYVDLENARVQAQKKQAEENLFMFGNGLAQLVWGTTGLVRGAVSLAASAAMTVSLFLQSGRVGWLNSPLWALALFLCALLAGLCQSWCTVRENRVFEKWCAGTVWYNRVFMFFGRELYMEPARAKDVRIYAQQGAADRALQALLRHDDADCRTYAQMAAYPALGRLAVGLSYALSYGFVAPFLGALLRATTVWRAGQRGGQYGKCTRFALQQFGKRVFRMGDATCLCWRTTPCIAGIWKACTLLLIGWPAIANTRARCPWKSARSARMATWNMKSNCATCPSAIPAASLALRGVSARLCAGDRWPSSGRMAAANHAIKLLLPPARSRRGRDSCLTASISANTIMRSTCGCSLWCFRISACWRSCAGENVAASQDVDAQRARECLARAGLGGRLAAMPEGLETPLYKEAGGVEVSGGEAQKIALARAVYRHAPFIVLDEPTAALDPVAEFEVYSRFDEIVGERTAVYISHRLASCRFCRAIWVFDGAALCNRRA